ncbi:hypothetical protein ACAH01_08755 [Halomicrobium sp. HM KBTZ05]|uniref:hypothetical protein n=1 Tax=Halomicrobium sp. HM KBTZ05 TaxID=3242663 RepID=UPI003557A9AB
MSLRGQAHRVDEPVETEVPDSREYDSESAAEVDEALCEAIAAAEADDNEYLAQLLRHELGSHYYQTR